MRQFFPSAMTFFLLLVVLANAWSGERHYTFEDDKAWEVITGEWKIKKGEYHSTKDAEEAIVLLKKNEGVDMAGVEYISVQAYDLGTGPWQNIFIVFGNDGKALNYYLGGVFVGGRQKWAFDNIGMKTNKRAGALQEVGCVPNCPPLKWFEIRLEIKNGEAILIGGEKGDKVKERVRHKFGKIPSGRVGLGSSKSIVKYKDFIVGGKGVQSMPVSPQERMTTTWARIKRND
ncbi:MAG: hypothetical protein QF569_24995 [Candidatus Poribacteria bacterium]|jgi:hypothetical protein|nr:hypothetical protein [Candidatus Poribacteria bacterium]